MSTKLHFYCRFCAEEKPYQEITNLTSQENQQYLNEKLSVLGLSLVDFSNKVLPKTVCISCYELTTVSSEFILKVKRSQDVLRELCAVSGSRSTSALTNYVAVKTEIDDGEDFQDNLSSFEDEETFVKEEKFVYGGIEVFIEPNDTRISVKSKDKTWDTYPWQCYICGIKPGSVTDLREHCQREHVKCFAFKCADCDERQDNYDMFVEHVRGHRKGLRNICQYCDVDITDNPKHNSKHASAHTCLVCGASFRLKRHLRTHLKKTKQSITKPSKKSYNGPPTNCPCPVCGMIMKTPASLKGHLNIHTDRKRNYTCESCGKAYYTKGSLDIHRKIHDNTMKETCRICHKTFLTIPRLKKHVKTHNLELPFQCDQCKRFFSSKDRMREHVKVHMNILPFKCSYCSKKFRHKSIMKTHEYQHTGARPYSCYLCCMDFANWSNCNKHMKRKHGTTLAKNVMTPHGKLALNPETGKPDQLYIDKNVKEWSEVMLMGRSKKNSIDKVSL